MREVSHICYDSKDLELPYKKNLVLGDIRELNKELHIRLSTLYTNI